jgi:hypothetical protein
MSATPMNCLINFLASLTKFMKFMASNTLINNTIDTGSASQKQKKEQIKAHFKGLVAY